MIADKYYEPPLINIIKFACNACPEKVIKVTSMCQGCLAHPCQEVCPKKAISFRNGTQPYRPEPCASSAAAASSACPYNAIIKLERPCAKACGMDAIRSDEHGRAEIDYDKCVSCGMCLVNCPFGAIVDKGQIFQLIQAIKRGDRVVAIVAPAFVGQFGPALTPDKLRAAMKQLGFAGVSEVAVGADLCTIEEAKDFMEEVPEKHALHGHLLLPGLVASWPRSSSPSMPTASRMALTPMVLTARLIKHTDTERAASALWVPAPPRSWRPAAAASAATWTSSSPSRSSWACSRPRASTLPSLPDDKNDTFDDASADGRGFAVTGGVAQAVVRRHPQAGSRTVRSRWLRHRVWRTAAR